MKNLALGNSGDYVCEVSGEAPKFKTEAGSGQMRVIDLPDERPIIKVFPFSFLRQNHAWQFNLKSYGHYLKEGGTNQKLPTQPNFFLTAVHCSN